MLTALAVGAAATEIAHAYGLDHARDCHDLMTYMKPCGRLEFIDKDIPCGEHQTRDCANGAPTQNSFARLTELLGPAVPPARPTE